MNDRWFSAIATTVLGLISTFGVFKYLIEPRIIERQTQKKYATALWIACRELKAHLEQIEDRLNQPDVHLKDALMKIPNNDFGKKADWFTKEGYFTTVTAYKIATVSAWIRIYQQDLLFAIYPTTRTFFSTLYNRASEINLAFSTDSIMWYYYFEAIGDKITSTNNILRPMSFSTFCEKYYTEEQFRLFFEQVHMFLWFVATDKYKPHLSSIIVALSNMISDLETLKLVNGLNIKKRHDDLEGLQAEK